MIMDDRLSMSFFGLKRGHCGVKSPGVISKLAPDPVTFPAPRMDLLEPRTLILCVSWPHDHDPTLAAFSRPWNWVRRSRWVDVGRLRRKQTESRGTWQHKRDSWLLGKGIDLTMPADSSILSVVDTAESSRGPGTWGRCAPHTLKAVQRSAYPSVRPGPALSFSVETSGLTLSRPDRSHAKCIAADVDLVCERLQPHHTVSALANWDMLSIQASLILTSPSHANYPVAADGTRLNRGRF